MKFVVRFLSRQAVIFFLGTMPIATSVAAFEINRNAPRVGQAQDSSAQNSYSVAELFSKLADHNNWQQGNLDQFAATRIYKVKDINGLTLAEESVQMEYKSPGTKTFAITSAAGSSFVRGHVFQQLMKREAARAEESHDQDSSITPANYTLEVLGKDQLGATHCILLHAFPKRMEQYLFEGKIWIDDHDFAIVKVTGHLAKNPSFWVKRVDFVRDYQKIDGFWLPQREQLTAQIRIYGTKILTIDYENYKVNQGASTPPIEESDRTQTVTEQQPISIAPYWQKK